MALFAIADLHLSCDTEKPMDIFGGNWQGYTEKIKKNFNAMISPEDTVVIGGDISWGMSFQEAKNDFALIDALPGKKIILKGNHDLWWSTMSKMQKFLKENKFHTIQFLHNNYYLYNNATAICGTRGWFYEENFKEKNDAKIFKRELMRLETSLKMAKEHNAEEIYCFLHYPPVYTNFRCMEIINLMKQYQVTKCIYGHLHGDSLQYAFTGEEEGIQFILVSGDYINFAPVLLKN